MTLPFDAQLRQARLAHLGYWLCFGAGSAGLYGSVSSAPTAFAAAVAAVLFAALVVICLTGLYGSWDAMTAYEQ